MNFVVTPLHRRLAATTLLLLVAVLVGACGPVHAEPRWSSLSTSPDGSQILLAFGDRLTLIDVDDGKPVPLLDADGDVRTDEQGNPRAWEVLATDNRQTRFYTTPVYLDDDTILATSYDMRLLEVDFPVARIDGDEAVVDQHIVAAPVVDGDMIYVGLSDSDLVAFDVENLEEQWRVDTGHGVWAEPLIVDDRLYFTSMDHHLYAVNKRTGEMLWKTNLQGALTATPVYQDGHLYVGGFAKKIFDVSAETGEILGEFVTREWIWNAPALVDGVLYSADLGGAVYALSTDDGLNELWTTQASVRATAPTPLVTDEFVIVGSRDNNVYWLNREDGAVVDTKAVAGEVLSNLLLIEPSDTVDIPEPLVIVSTSAPQELLVAFTLENGERRWTYGR